VQTALGRLIPSSAFGNPATSMVEGGHASLKGYLQISTTNLKRVLDNIEMLLKTQNQEFETTCDWENSTRFGTPNNIAHQSRDSPFMDIFLHCQLILAAPTSDNEIPRTWSRTGQARSIPSGSNLLSNRPREAKSSNRQKPPQFVSMRRRALRNPAMVVMIDKELL
jgi:hypothetical protein